MIGDISIKEATTDMLGRGKMGKTAEQIVETISTRLGQKIKKDTVYKRLHELIHSNKAILGDYVVLSDTQNRYVNTYRMI